MVPGISWLKSHLDRYGSDDSESEEPVETNVYLFECSQCERTYIADEMEACPECSDEITRVPTERELGPQ